jgi:hypothetical protein
LLTKAGAIVKVGECIVDAKQGLVNTGEVTLFDPCARRRRVSLF